jgi:hypothetical protein
MVQTRERPQLPEHEVEREFREIVEREGTPVEEPTREIPPSKPPVETAQRHPNRSMRWLAVFAVLAVSALVLLRFAADGETAARSTYVADPMAELDLIDHAVAEFEATLPFVYTASASTELDLIEQLVADYRTAHPYLAVAAAEMALIDQAVERFIERASTYVPDARAELDLIRGAAGPGVAESTYVPDARAELDLIDQAIAAAV